MRPLRAGLCLLLLLLLVLRTRSLPLLPHEFGQSFQQGSQSEHVWPFQQERSEKPHFHWQDSGLPVKSALSPTFPTMWEQQQQHQAPYKYRDQSVQKGYSFGQKPAEQQVTNIFGQQTPWTQDQKPQEWNLQQKEGVQRPGQWHFQPNHHQQQPRQFQWAEQKPQWEEQPLGKTESNIQKSSAGPLFNHPLAQHRQQHPHPWQFQQNEQQPQLPSMRAQPLNEAGGQFLGFPEQDFHPAQHNNFWSAPRSQFRGPYQPQNNIVYMPQYNNQPIMMHAYPPSAPGSHRIPEDLVAGRFSSSTGKSEDETQKGVTEAMKTEEAVTTPSFLPELDQWFKEHAAELEANKTAKEQADSGAKLADFVKKYGPAIYEKLKAVQTEKPSQ
ncbi:hypothetical protein SprV_0702295200 [Sparganum proliferum]